MGEVIFQTFSNFFQTRVGSQTRLSSEPDWSPAPATRAVPGDPPRPRVPVAVLGGTPGSPHQTPLCVYQVPGTHICGGCHEEG